MSGNPGKKEIFFYFYFFLVSTKNVKAVESKIYFKYDFINLIFLYTKTVIIQKMHRSKSFCMRYHLKSDNFCSIRLKKNLVRKVQ